jgi:V-type H+-transporting ATPase subunit F
MILNSLSETQVSTIEAAFQDFTERRDIAILLINQHVSLSA